MESRLDELHTWDRKLTKDELEELYNSKFHWRWIFFKEKIKRWLKKWKRNID